ncbi:hypothetical protein BC829DRAFT_46791 [Chytridium lagenaria]|nr:hypothetical protein BC829DRAFT_46791 [Chytridium lagenaria]
MHFTSLPAELLPRISTFLKEVDIQKIVLAFPSLLWLLETYHLSRQHLRCTQEFKSVSSIEWLQLPTWAIKYGPSTMMKFSDAAFFKSNVEGCCRVAALMVYFQLGHMKDTDVYTVAYNPVTQEAVAVEFEDVMLSVFYGKPCYGALFKVKQQDPAKREPETDFRASVDRTYMTYRFGSQFVGDGYLDNFYNRVTCHIPQSLSSDSDTDEDDTKNSDIDDADTKPDDETEKKLR